MKGRLRFGRADAVTQWVAMAKPSSGEKPIVVAMLRPPSMAQSDHPALRAGLPVVNSV